MIWCSSFLVPLKRTICSTTYWRIAKNREIRPSAQRHRMEGAAQRRARQGQNASSLNCCPEKMEGIIGELGIGSKESSSVMTAPTNGRLFLAALFRDTDLNEAAGAADATRGLNYEGSRRPVDL